MTGYCFKVLSLGKVCYAAQNNWYSLKLLHFSKKIEEAKRRRGREDPLETGFLGCRVVCFYRYAVLIFSLLFQLYISYFSPHTYKTKSEVDQS